MEISVLCIWRTVKKTFTCTLTAVKKINCIPQFLTVNGEKYYFMSPYVCSEWPQELTLDIIQSESIVYAIDMEGQTGFYKITTGNKLETWNPNEGQENFQNQMKILIIILAVTLVIMFLAIFLVIHMDKNKQRQDGTSVFGKTNNRIKTRKNQIKTRRIRSFL